MSDETPKQKEQPMTDVKIHPAAELFSMMSDAEYEQLRGDIKQNGVREPLIFVGETLDDAQLIDGRNRLRAIVEVGLNWRDHVRLISPQEIPDPIGYVLSLNLHRRHLSESQRAMIANRVAEMKQGRPETNASIAAFKSRSQTEAASTLNISRESVQRARKVHQNAVPDIVKAVERGEVTVSAAAVVADLPPAEQQRLINSGPKAIKEAASVERAKFTGKPSGGTKFDPFEFDPAMYVDTTGVPKHLVEVLPAAKLAQQFQREINDFKKRAMAYCVSRGGSFTNGQDIERLCDQIHTNIKGGAFAMNCPQCKNEPLKSCPKCEGRGFLSHLLSLSVVTDADRAWLKKQETPDCLASQFDQAMHVDTTGVPAHLVEVLVTAKVIKSLQREINDFKKRSLAVCETVGGSYIHAQDTERLCEQIRVNLKTANFEFNCPQCKNEPLRSCPRCSGRGFLSHGHAGRLNKFDKEWLAKQPKIDGTE